MLSASAVSLRIVTGSDARPATTKTSIGKEASDE